MQDGFKKGPHHLPDAQFESCLVVVWYEPSKLHLHSFYLPDEEIGGGSDLFRQLVSKALPGKEEPG